MKNLIFFLFLCAIGCSKDSSIELPNNKSFRPIRYELSQTGSAYVLKNGNFQPIDLPISFSDPANYQDSSEYQIIFIDEPTLYSFEFLNEDTVKLTWNDFPDLIVLNLAFTQNGDQIIIDGGQQLYPAGTKILLEYNEAKSELSLPLLEVFKFQPIFTGITYLPDWNKNGSIQDQLNQVKLDPDLQFNELDTIVLFHHNVIYK